MAYNHRGSAAARVQMLDAILAQTQELARQAQAARTMALIEERGLAVNGQRVEKELGLAVEMETTMLQMQASHASLGDLVEGAFNASVLERSLDAA